jgi:hypothetical protein
MNLSDPIYHNADKARDHLEALLWADGPVCPHCKVRDHASKIKGGRKAHNGGQGVHLVGELLMMDHYDGVYDVRISLSFASTTTYGQVAFA